ncbi:MAG: hypothetical protein V3574_02570 [Candidatus Moraniibacteriota bacterium]
MALEFSCEGKGFKLDAYLIAQVSSLQNVKVRVSFFDEKCELLSEEYSGEIKKIREVCSYCSKRISENENCLKAEVNNFLLYHSPKKISIKFSTMCPNCQMEQDEIILFPGDSFGIFFEKR